MIRMGALRQRGLLAFLLVSACPFQRSWGQGGVAKVPLLGEGASLSGLPLAAPGEILRNNPASAGGIPVLESGASLSIDGALPTVMPASALAAPELPPASADGLVPEADGREKPAGALESAKQLAEPSLTPAASGKIFDKNMQKSGEAEAPVKAEPGKTARAGGLKKKSAKARKEYPGDAAVKARKVVEQTFVIYDLETTGLYAEVHHPMQLGATKFRVKADGSVEVLGSFERVIDPKAPLPSFITWLTGITNGDLKGQPTLEKALSDFRKFAGEDAVLLAHNAPFDTAFLGHHFKDLGLSPMPQLVLDTKDLTKNLFPDITDRRLQELILRWNLGGLQTHTALSDTFFTAKVFAHLLGRIAEVKKKGVGELTVADVAAHSVNLHFDAILDDLKPVPPQGRTQPVVAAELDKQLEETSFQLLLKGKVTHLRDIVAVLGLDYEEVRAALVDKSMKEAVSPADAILERVAAEPPATLIFNYDALVDRVGEAAPGPSDEIVSAVTALLEAGRAVGVSEIHGLDAAALRQKIAPELRARLFLTAKGAKPLYEIMRAAGVVKDEKRLLVVGMHESLAQAFPSARVLSVGDPVKGFQPVDGHRLGLKGTRGSLRLIAAALKQSSAAEAPKAGKAGKAVAPSGPSAEAPARLVSRSFSWFDDVFGPAVSTGKKDFLPALKKAIRSQSKAQWQGPSWFALVGALSDESSARGVHLNSRLSAREMTDALKHLKSAGLIKNLPPKQNLRTLAGAAAKAAAFKEVLDGLQKQALGEGAEKVVGPDGVRRKPMHIAELSVGDWSDFAGVSASLSGTVRRQQKKPRWSNVKIILRYNGADGTRDPVELVIQGDGKTRPLTAAERAEFSISAEEAKPADKDALPASVQTRSALPGVDSAVAQMFVSHSYGNANPKVVDGDDRLARERGAIEAFLADRSVASKRKRIILSRYHVEDKTLAAVLIKAAKAGVQVDFITDFNSSMEYKFKKRDSTVLTDFSKARVKDNALGEFLQLLLDGGFQIVGNGSKSRPKGAIYSQPIYKVTRREMIPIMHEKSLLLVVEPKAGSKQGPEVQEYYFGTANLSDNPRYDRGFRVSDEKLSMSAALEHAQRLMDVFRVGKGISDMPDEAPFRVWFEDESFMEAAYTNGRQNPNDRIVDLFERGARGELQIEGVYFSHFAATKREIYISLKEAMKAQSNFRVYGVLDGRFAPVDTYGKGAVMGGFVVTPPLGGPLWAWPKDLVKRVTLYEYIRPVEGRVETDIDGPPVARHLWHDKTTLVYVNEGGKRWAYVYTGGFNASNHVDNADLEVLFRFPADSPMVQSILESITETVKREPEYAVPLKDGLLRDVVGSMVGLSSLYVPGEIAQKLFAAASSGDMSQVTPLIHELVHGGMKILGDQFSPDKAAQKLLRFSEFVEWYFAERAAGRLRYPFTIQKFVALATVVSHMDDGKMSPAWLKLHLKHVVWDPSAGPDEMETRVRGAWDILGIPVPMPSRLKDRGLDASSEPPASKSKKTGK